VQLNETMAATLLAEPRWTLAARALISGCIDLPDLEAKVNLLEGVCRALGDELYPAFLRVLAEVGHHGDHDARAAVAQVLVHALQTGRLPSGRRAAWGATSTASSLSRGRSLGPLEYLCAWAGQGEVMNHLVQREFEQAAQAVIQLVNADPTARGLYCGQLIAEADDPIEGALSRGTRAAMRNMATAWIGEASAADVAAAFVTSLAAPAPAAGWPASLGLAGLPRARFE
jgi:hypothetical protein